ncbi:hypothetical protein Daus18300_009938 [Diaporthe australafricana]|uniref:Protein kinase domain-containing protein n=1 Tax=Diaporthe australafricana TaxID=127596 RepID=A0ABR3WCG1_9PEZI
MSSLWPRSSCINSSGPNGIDSNSTISLGYVWQDLLITLACSELNDVSTYERIYPSIGAYLGTGAVFVVERKEAKGRKLVAVKHIRRHFESGQLSLSSQSMRETLEAVLLEVQVLLHLNSLRHRNIVRLLAYGWEDGPLPYLVLEYADCGFLNDFLQANKQPWEEKERVAIGIASALELLHACEVVHGDIKLENILVFSNRKRGFDAKLADFGFSCSTALGRPAIRGTYIINAPEIRCSDTRETPAADDILAHEKADVYSYGPALWEILNDGRRYYSVPPFEISVGEHEFEQITSLLKSLDSSAAEIVPHALEFVRNLGDIPHEMASRATRAFELALARDPQARSEIRDIREKLDFSGESEPEIATPLLAPCYSAFDISTSQFPWEAREQMRNSFDLGCHQDIRQGRDAFQASVFSAIGFGTTVNERDALDRLRESSRLGYLPATILCHELFARGPQETPIDARNAESVDFLQEFRVKHHHTPPDQRFAKLLRSFYKFHNSAAARKSLELDIGGKTMRIDDQGQLDGLLGRYSCEEVDEAVVTTDVWGQPVLKPLMHHLILSHSALAENLLRRGCDPSKRTHNLLSMLIVACAAGSKTLVELLLELCPEYAIRSTREGISPLHWLFMFDDEEMFEVGQRLVNARANLQRVGVQVFAEFNLVFAGSPLHWAIMARSTTAIRTLIELGADPNAEVPRATVECLECPPVPLDLAVMLLMHEIVELMLQLGATMDGASDSDQRTPIHFIGDGVTDPFRLWLYHGSKDSEIDAAVTKTLDVLISHGADINCKADSHEMTPLEFILTQRTDLIWVLRGFLQHQPELTKGLLRTAATSLRHDQANCQKLNLLLEYHSTNGSRGDFAEECKSAARTCVQDGTVAAGRAILSHLGSEAREFIDDEELIHLAAENDHPQMIKVLLDFGGNINLDSEGTPAANAAARSKRRALKCLLDHGADVYSEPSKNEEATILHDIVADTVSRHESELTLEFLCDNQTFRDKLSSVVNNYDPRGVTALHETIIWGSVANVCTLVVILGAKDLCILDTDVSPLLLARMVVESPPWLITQQGSSGVQRHRRDVSEIAEFLKSANFRVPQPALDTTTQSEGITRWWTKPSKSAWSETDHLRDWYTPATYGDTGRSSDSET